MPLKPWRVKSSRIIHQTPWIDVIEDVCQTEVSQLTYTYINRRDGGPIVIPEASVDHLWLVRQYRHPIHQIAWQFPAEGVMPNENLVSAAHRCLQEELQLDATHMISLGQAFVDPGSSGQKTEYFLARNLSPKTPETYFKADEQEHEEVEGKLFSLSEIEDLIQKNEICDNWTFAGLFLYKRFLEKK